MINNYVYPKKKDKKIYLAFFPRHLHKQRKRRRSHNQSHTHTHTASSEKWYENISVIELYSQVLSYVSTTISQTQNSLPSVRLASIYKYNEQRWKHYRFNFYSCVKCSHNVLSVTLCVQRNQLRLISSSSSRNQPTSSLCSRKRTFLVIFQFQRLRNEYLNIADRVFVFFGTR